MKLKPIFEKVVELNASDIFFKVGLPISARIAGKVESLGGPVLTVEVMDRILEEVADAKAHREFDKTNEADSSYELEGVGRFRINIFRQRGYPGMVFRYVKSEIPSMNELRLPRESLEKIADEPRGLVLVTGVAGSGKSTTLAAMLEYINKHQKKHVVTIEDPIEYVFNDELCVFDQREIGRDTNSFNSALKVAVRQSPDVLMIGEMRDVETMEAAFNAAETGHLVFSTLHTVNAVQTVDRILNYFPPHLHKYYQTQMALLLKAVVSQRLVPTGDGLIVVVEIMRTSPRIRELLEEGKPRQLEKAIRDGSYYGNQTFNQSLKLLIDEGLVSQEDAVKYADDPEALEMEMRGISRKNRFET